MPEGLDRWLHLALAGPDASGPALLATIAAGWLIGLVPLHLVLIWAGGDRMMRFIALTSVLAIALALAAGHAIAHVAGLLADAPPADRGVGASVAGQTLVFFTYAAVLAIFGRGRIGWGVAALGLVAAWSAITLGLHRPRDVAGAAAIGSAAAVAASYAMTCVGVRALGRLEAVMGAAGGMIGRRLLRS